jgi:hypothetical protein
MALDFTTASLDARVTVTRALDTATRINSSGVVEVVNANLPRFDFDPLTGVCRGLLIEETRFNAHTSSGLYDATWAIANVTPNAIDISTSPTGTGTKFLETTANAEHLCDYARFFHANSSTVTHSIWLRGGLGRDYIGLIVDDNAGNGSGCVVNLAAGTVGSVTNRGTGTNGSATIQAFLDGWYRVSISTQFTAPSGQSRGICVIYKDATLVSTYVGDVTKGVYLTGTQIEAGAFATSYIPTTTTSLTRNADVVSMTGTNFSDWYNATEGALLVQATAEIPATDANVRFAAAIYDTAAYANAFRLERLSGNCRAIKTVSGSSLVASYSWPIDVTGKAIMSYKDSSSASSFRAANPGLYAGGVPSGMAYLGIGGSHVGSNVWCGHVQRIQYWPQRLINAETQAFTKD